MAIRVRIMLDADRAFLVYIVRPGYVAWAAASTDEFMRNQ